MFRSAAGPSYNPPMRRILAITLLIGFGSPLVLPLFAATAGAEASLPACCRRHGMHRCTMIMAPGAPSGPVFQASPCPLFPAASTPPRLGTAYFTTPLLPSVEPLRDPAPHAPSLHRAQTFTTSSHYTRGPPTLLA